MTPDLPGRDEVDVTPPATRRSLNEIEAMGKRAARGVGLPWGIAEEAGKAARWLAMLGLPGAKHLADILTRHDTQRYEWLTPIVVDGIWRAEKGPLCPLITGAALSDLATSIAQGRSIELGETADPLLLTPYVATAAKLAACPLALSFGGTSLFLYSDMQRPDIVAIEGNQEILTSKDTRGVICRRSDGLPADANILPRLSELQLVVDAQTWDRLNAFATRTYAPATEASRLKGAGAGLSDNN